MAVPSGNYFVTESAPPQPLPFLKNPKVPSGLTRLETLATPDVSGQKHTLSNSLYIPTTFYLCFPLFVNVMIKGVYTEVIFPHGNF